MDSVCFALTSFPSLTCASSNKGVGRLDSTVGQVEPLLSGLEVSDESNTYPCAPTRVVSTGLIASERPLTHGNLAVLGRRFVFDVISEGT